MGKSRQAEHQQFLSWLITTAVAQQVDAIIVAGDIFDTGSPPSYARELYNRFIVNLQATGIHLIILGGNHDSVAMLNESKELLACLNTHVIPGALANIAEQVITLKNAEQEAIAIVCAIPFLRPRDIMHSVAGQSGSEKQQSLQQAISQHYQSIYALAKQQAEQQHISTGKALPIIATGHLTTVGAKSSESVRDIYIGTLDAFPSSAFPPADYIALGHIHRAQIVGGNEHIRYCGSPIPLSFDELNNDKTIVLVEFAQAAISQINSIIIPRFQPMHLIKGDLASIETEIKQLATQYTQEHVAWLDIEVATEDFLNDLQQRIQNLVAGLPLEVLLLRRQRTQKTRSMEAISKETLHELTPTEVFERRLALEDWSTDKKGVSEDAPEIVASQQKLQRLHKAFDEILGQIKNGEAET